MSRYPIIVAVLTVAMAGCSQQESEAPVSAANISVVADSVYTNGKIYTVNDAQPWAEAVAVKDGKFLVVGSNEDIKAVTGDKTELVDLGGKMAMPGLVDLHQHLLTVADGTSYIQLSEPNDADAMVQEIKAYADANPDMPVVRGEQWNLGVFPNDSPRKELLDAIVPDRPAYFTSQTGHSAWVNSKALELAGITKDTPQTKKFIFDTDPETGEPTGTVREYAMAGVLQAIPKTPVEQMLPRLTELSESFAQAGFTSLKLAEGRPHHAKAAAMVEAQGDLLSRLFLSWEWESHYNEYTDGEMAEVIVNWKDYKTDLIEPRYVKIFADGGPDSYTALLYEDYEGRPGFKGATHRPKEALLKAVSEFNAAGLGVIVHALGDGTGGQLVDIFTEVSQQESFKKDAVLHFSHAWMTTPSDLERLSKVDGVSIDFSPLLNYRHPAIVGTFVPPIGEERYQKFFNVRSAIEAGLPVGFGSDYPSMLFPEINGFHQIQAWVTRVDPEVPDNEPLNPSQAITLEQAIRGFTLDATASMGFDWPEKLGSIEQGKLADFIVLDRDIFETPIEKLYHTQVDLTVVGGRVVFERD